MMFTKVNAKMLRFIGNIVGCDDLYSQIFFILFIDERLYLLTH